MSRSGKHSFICAEQNISRKKMLKQCVLLIDNIIVIQDITFRSLRGV